LVTCTTMAWPPTAKVCLIKKCLNSGDGKPYRGQMLKRLDSVISEGICMGKTRKMSLASVGTRMFHEILRPSLY
jgi:hypothetical protein